MMANRKKESIHKPVIRTWMVKRCYDCPRSFWFVFHRYNKKPTAEMREKWAAGYEFEDMKIKELGAFSQCCIELELPKFILQGHLDGLTLDGCTFVGHEIKGYECRTRDAYEQDKFQSEVYLYLMRNKMPRADSKMILHYKNRKFPIGTYNETRIENLFREIENIIDHPHNIPYISPDRVRKSYLCSSAKCDWKPFCKAFDINKPRGNKK